MSPIDQVLDFIVEIVDPKKDETVLDPASGTSGFLISAFKHIVNSNSKKSSGDLLSAAERKKIMKNINGYDISPDMVRIGLANMYLHGFPEPNVTVLSPPVFPAGPSCPGLGTATFGPPAPIE